MRDRVITERGEVRPHINIFVDGEDIRYAGGLDIRSRRRRAVPAARDQRGRWVIKDVESRLIMTTRCLLTILAFASVTGHAAAQQLPPLPIQDAQVIPLWTGAAPGALGTDETDVPAITVYLPRTVGANTPAVLICPGGRTARWRRIMKDGRSPATSTRSASRPSCCAIASVPAITIRLSWATRSAPSACCDRTRPTGASIPARIGIIGFSAGGHLAMTASTHFDAGNAAPPTRSTAPAAVPTSPSSAIRLSR